jgi:hypothetical protein
MVRPLPSSRHAPRRTRSYNVFTKALRLGRNKLIEDKFDEARPADSSPERHSCGGGRTQPEARG